MTTTRSERVALVTGASSAVGGAVASALAADCAAVAVHYHSDAEGARRTAARVRRAGAEACLVRTRLDRGEGPSVLADKVRRKLGRIDVLVHTVGPFLQKRWDRLTPEDWEQTLRDNLIVAHGCLLAVLPGMRRRKWGRIILFGYGRLGQETSFPGILPYAAAKAGLWLLVRTAAATEASRGITVNMVSPGLLTTGLRPRGLDPDRHPLGTPEDVAEAACFLASPRASRVSGSNLVVAGTWKM